MEVKQNSHNLKINMEIDFIEFQTERMGVVDFAPGEEEEGVRVLEFQEPEVVGEGGQAPELKIQNRKLVRSDVVHSCRHQQEGLDNSS